VQSIRICILCTIFMMEILLHWGNISVDFQIEDYLTDLYLKGCIVIWEKQALSWRMHLLVMEDTASRMLRLCWIMHVITHQPALVTFILQRTTFLAVWHTVHGNKLYFLNLQLVYVLQQGKTSPTVFQWVLCKMSRVSLGSIVSDYGLGDWGSIPGGGKGFFL
jgi:hypothetical protein